MLLICLGKSRAQSFGFRYNEKVNKIEVPFEVRNNFIIVRITFNEKIPLNFIFDTGAEHTILTKKIYSQILGLKIDRSINFVGSDLKMVMTAHVARNVHIKLGEAVAPTQDLLVLAEDYINLDELVGKEIHGILGVDLFRHFTLQIDNKRNKLIFHHPKEFKLPRGKWSEIPITIEKGKPYINVNGFYNNKKLDLKLLIDTGASLSLLLHTNSHPDIDLPKKYIAGNIGTGLGGQLNGFIGRVDKLEFDRFYFNQMITNFQDLPSIADSIYIFKRNGIFGNALLMRFQIIIDYQNSKAYFLPHKKYNRSLGFDKSGLNLIASGKNLKTILTHFVIPNSPADKVGIIKGDVIKKINGLPTKLLSLREVVRKLQKRSGKNIRLTIKRGGKKMKIKFKLEELI